MEKREEIAFSDIEYLSKKNSFLSEEALNYIKLNSELQEKLLAQEKVIEEYSCRIDELESQIQLFYKEQIEDFTILTEHLKKDIQLKEKLIVESKHWRNKYEILASSKLGRFTIKYWKYRDKLKAKFKKIMQ